MFNHAHVSPAEGIAINRTAQILTRQKAFIHSYHYYGSLLQENLEKALGKEAGKALAHKVSRVIACETGLNADTAPLVQTIENLIQIDLIASISGKKTYLTQAQAAAKRMLGQYAAYHRWQNTLGLTTDENKHITMSVVNPHFSAQNQERCLYMWETMEMMINKPTMSNTLVFRLPGSHPAMPS